MVGRFGETVMTICRMLTICIYIVMDLKIPLYEGSDISNTKLASCVSSSRSTFVNRNSSLSFPTPSMKHPSCCSQAMSSGENLEVCVLRVARSLFFSDIQELER